MVDAKWIEKKIELIQEQVNSLKWQMENMEEELKNGVSVRRMKDIYSDYTFNEELVKKLQHEINIYESILR